MNTKSLFKSKTIAASFITTLAGVIAAFVPSVGEFVAENAAGILLTLGGLNFALRLLTKEKISLFPDDNL
ncbi:MAG: hypothetical protein VYC85_01135 [Pseudomonadota bacterium]|nr:hypothetical protein [Pseudomonadota bacterium]